MQREFVSHSDQFNWGIQQIDKSDWVIRLDADEYMDDTLVRSIQSSLLQNPSSITGFEFNRRIRFLGKDITYGGIFPVKVVRMFRYGFAEVEPRLMDEHIVVQGETRCLDGELVDDNKNSLSWWITKHNRYSSMEALEMFAITHYDAQGTVVSGSAASRRQLKNLYTKVPIPLRATLLFLYRYIFRLGFFDGFYGFIFHFYQGYWYRLLVDSKYKLLLESVECDRFTMKECARILEVSEAVVESKLTR